MAAPADIEWNPIGGGVANRGYGGETGLTSGQIRRDFVRKVYGTVSLQLAATALMAKPICTASDAWLSKNRHWIFFSAVLTFAVLAFGACSRGGMRQTMRRFPTNMVMLSIFTVGESVMVGFICASYEVQTVVMGAGLTAAVVMALTIFALTTEVDATKWGPQLAVCCFALLIASFVGLFMGGSMFNLLIACGGALLFSGYLVHDTQAIMDNKHDELRGVSIDDYAYASLMIYMDIVRIFIYLLRIVAELSGDRRRRR